MLNKTQIKARRILNNAIENLKPHAIGDTLKGIKPNGEAQAISTLAVAMCLVVSAK